MKFKHVFLSSLLVSTAFVACTNEDFAEISTPANTKDAIALGEGFTIVGAKTGDDADTRAIFTDNLAGTLWEKTDVVGAAWYNMITGFEEDGTVKSVADAFSKKFASNIWFKWSKQVGSDMSSAEFKSEANAMAGAYVLYYPYNEEWTAAADEIPVEISNLQTMDCTAGKEKVELNKNIFAYSVYPFVPGGAQTKEFKLTQVQNVFAIKFQVDKPNLMVLEKPVTIAKVIIEASKTGTSVLRSEGKVTPPSAAVTKDSYNKNTLGKAVYASASEAADHLILTVENATDDYSIQALKTPTKKPFYLSTLPFSEAADKVTFKILTTDGKVYSQDYVPGAVLTAINKLATAEGKLVEITVTLANLNDEGTIYTAEQFENQWNAALAAEKATTLALGEGVDLSDVDLSVANAKAAITLEGKSVKVKSLTVSNGKLIIKNDLSVTGDVVIGSNAKGFETGDAGKLSIAGEFNVKGIRGEVAIAQMNKLNIDASGVITINGPADKTKSGTIVNEGKLTLKSININKLTNDGSGAVTIGDANVVNDGTITNDGEFDFGTYAFNNNGIFSQRDVVKGSGEFKNNAGATLNITANTELKITNEAAKADKNLAAAVINLTGSSTVATEVTTANNCTIANNGIINVNAYATLTESAAGSITQTDDDARINVAKDATLALETTAALAKGYVIALDKEATISGSDLTGEPIASIVTKDADVAGAIHQKATTLFVKGDLTVTSAIADVLKAKNLVLYNSLKLENDLEMTSTNSVVVAGDVKVTADDDSRKFKLIGTDNVINKGAGLTLGKNVILTGAASSELKALGSLVAGEGTITATGTGDLTIKY